MRSLKSAVLGLAASRYAAAFTRRLGRHLRHSRLAATLGQQRWIVDGAVRAARDDQRVFDVIVELGLGHQLRPENPQPCEGATRSWRLLLDAMTCYPP